ncbi:MAG: AraC family transcriptional regulator [Eubacteriales bacterium]|nr:AraC family transcriptional regulator [Eubacteriales bacterium]
MLLKNTLGVKIPTDLRDFEQILKGIYERHPERSLDTPHQTEESHDLLIYAASKLENSNEAAARLLASKLQEKSFFQQDLDVEVYQHFRYLPATIHSHTFFEIICVMQGSCTNYLNGHQLTMETGEICILAPETPHTLSVFTDDCIVFNIEIRTSTFETAFLDTLSDNDILADFFTRTLYHSASHPYLYFKTGEDQAVRNYLAYVYEEYHLKQQYKKRMMNSIITAFFITLLRNHGSDVILPNDGTGPSDPNTLFVLKYIQEHFSTVTLKELADFFNYSERQIQRIIKTSTGKSFSENIQHLKMKKAARLLENPDLSIASIAEELGYSDLGNFRNIFKKYYGMTLSEYRSKTHMQ